MKIQVGCYDVLEAGCITSINGQDIVFTLNENMKARLRFLSSESEKQSVNASIENKELIIKLTNFNNPLGTELASPIEVGTFNDKKLFLHLRIQGMTKSKNRVVFYTWLLNDNINNG